MIDRLDIDSIIRLLQRPEEFQSLGKLIENIVAYGQLEYIQGYYTGMFKEFEELFSRVEDIPAALEAKKFIDKYLLDNAEPERYDVIKQYMDLAFLAMMHNVNKKENKYGINRKK